MISDGSYLLLTITGLQSWLDERLFGWSRSAIRGNLWGGSEQPSRAVSPAGSDDEDHGDYEYVLGYLPSDGDGTPSRLRSRSVRSSYADLQQLKSTTPAHATGAALREEPALSPDDESGLHYRSIQHRDRRASLNDGVSVERIGAIDPEEPFKDATKDINQENVLRKHEDDAC